MRLMCAFASVAAVASIAQATTRSSFLEVDSVDSITAPTSDFGRTYTVTLGASPRFTVGESTYAVTKVIGFYVLSDVRDFSPFSALSTIGTYGPFTADTSNAGPGAMAGWRTLPTRGVGVGGSLAFTLPGDFPLGQIDRIGLRVMASGEAGTSDKAANIIMAQGRIPAPGAAAVLGIGGLLAARRRR